MKIEPLQALKSLLRKLPFRITKNQWYDVQTTRIIKAHCRRDSNCIDVGSLNGEILGMMLRYAPDGKHFAFEPLPEYYQKLIRTYGGKAEISACALSDKSGSTSFQFVKSNPSYSGLLRRRYDRAGETIKEITVRTETLDNLIPDDLPVHLIKIDVEGAELLVLRGGENLITRCRPLIIFEHGEGGANIYGYGPEDVFDFLCEHCGLQIYTLKGWLHQRNPLTRRDLNRHFETGSEYYFVAAGD